jgi:hypothetical protein
MNLSGMFALLAHDEPAEGFRAKWVVGPGMCGSPVSNRPALRAA